MLHATNRPNAPENQLEEYRLLMRGLRADARLGRFVEPIADQRPAAAVLTLTLALADAFEGNRPHPAHELLAEMEAGR